MKCADEVAAFEPAVDPGITYPCYKSLDEFVDVGRLKSLDGYVAERIRRHIEAQQDSYFWNLHRLDADAPEKPGSREIWLTRTRGGTPYDYLDLDRTELWQPTEAAEEFSELTDFIRSLPFSSTGRILIMYDNLGHAVPPHRDHLSPELCHEFVWFRTNLSKPFYMLDHRTGERLYVSSYSAWFDTVNQFHGSDPAPGLSFSVRVDGHFTDQFRRLLPQPRLNPASAPALWACSGASAE